MTNREFLRSLIIGNRSEEQLTSFHRTLLANLDRDAVEESGLSEIGVTITPVTPKPEPGDGGSLPPRSNV